MRECVRRRQATTAEQIATRPIHEARVQAAPFSGSSSRMLQWWQQDHSAPAEEFKKEKVTMMTMRMKARSNDNKDNNN